MREELFPRWGAALFALVPLSEILYSAVDTQTMYAAALACLICVPLGAAGAHFAPAVQRTRALQWLLAVCAVWPLVWSLARMTRFVWHTAFPKRPIWVVALLLTITALLLARVGQIRCAMWALPIWALSGIILIFSALLTLREVHISYLRAPTGELWTQTFTLLRSLLPAVLVLSLSLPKGLSGACARGLSMGGAAFALISLRAFLLLGAHTAALLPFPNFSAAGLAALGDFARHGEVFFAVPLILCELGRVAVLACVVIAPVRRSLGGAATPASQVATQG